MEADLDHDGKISFEEFTKMVENTDVSMSMTLGTLHPSFSRVPTPCQNPQKLTVFTRPILETAIPAGRNFARRFERDFGWLLGNSSPKATSYEKKNKKHIFCIHTACISHQSCFFWRGT
jgi:hypothetical protein